jgi:hypothetical protein
MPTFQPFYNFGYLQHKFTDQELKPVISEIDEISKDFSKAVPANSQLVGNIRKEYNLTKSKEYLKKLLFPFIDLYENNYNYFKTVEVLTSNLPFTLDSLWVNFQNKHEFNPMHNHSGVMSFVIWIKIPYSRISESKVAPGYASTRNCSGSFEFQFTNILGQIGGQLIDLDQTYENTMVMFPSRLNHCVYPFFSSDEYRISVSGNFYLKS